MKALSPRRPSCACGMPPSALLCKGAFFLRFRILYTALADKHYFIHILFIFQCYNICHIPSIITCSILYSSFSSFVSVPSSGLRSHPLGRMSGFCCLDAGARWIVGRPAWRRLVFGGLGERISGDEVRPTSGICGAGATRCRHEDKRTSRQTERAADDPPDAE